MSKALFGSEPLYALRQRPLGRYARFVVVTAIAVAIWASPTAAEQIRNGDFETGDLAEWTFSPKSTADPGMAPTVATFDGSSAFRVNTGNSFPAGHDATSGGTLTQTVALTGGVTYTVSGTVAMEERINNPGYVYVGGRISVFIDGTLIHQIGDGLVGLFLDPGQIVRSAFSYNFTPANTGPVEFAVEFGRRFTNTPPTIYHYADNLSIASESTSVSVDVKPADFPNTVNPYSRGVIPVAILGAGTFDVTDIDVTTLRFGPNGAGVAHNLNDSFPYNDHLLDVNLDGFTDLITHYRTWYTGISCGDESATLTGETLSGQAFEGSDSIRTVGCFSRRGMGRSRWRSWEEPE